MKKCILCFLVLFLFNTGGFSQDNNSLNTEILQAARSGNRSKVLALIIAGANINAKEPGNGITVLMWCVNKDLIDVVKVLVKKGARVNAQTSRGDTALVIAAKYKINPEMVEFLLKNGAKADVRVRFKRTLVMEVLSSVSVSQFFQNRKPYNNGIKIAKLLIQYGASMSAVDKDGVTPLMYGVRSGNYSIVKLLIQKKSLINKKANNGKTSLQMAIENKEKKLIPLLKKYGAQ